MPSGANAGDLPPGIYRGYGLFPVFPAACGQRSERVGIETVTRMCVVLVLCLAVSSCIDVIDARPYGVWLQEPMIGFGNPDKVAESHCANYGKTAVRTGTLGSGAQNQNYVPILAYACE
jgi:hypothetical protein